LLPGVAAY